MNQQRSKPGPHKAAWAAMTWVHKSTGSELTIESDHKILCKKLFDMSVSNKWEWREEK